MQTVPRPATVHVINDMTEVIREIHRKTWEEPENESKKWKKKESRLKKELFNKIFIKPRNVAQGKIPTRRRIAQVKKKLQGLVITNMDRHRGEVSIECPCNHYKNLEKMYGQEKNATETEKEIIRKMKKEYKWNHIAKLKTKGGIPGPVYNLNKEKDITRQSPVRPSFGTRNKQLMSITARVINFWIDRANLKTRNWHIANVLNLRKHWEREKKRISIYGKSTRFIFKPGDIKDFFTTCEHHEAINAVQYIKERYKGKTNLYRVRKRGRKGVKNTTRGTLGDKRFTIISADEVMEILQYTLKNQYYKMGTTVKQQTIGFPMGEAIAPPGANSIATAAMEKWAEENEQEFKRTTILRFVDDMISIIAYDANDPETLKTGQKILNNLYKDKKTNDKGIFKTPIRIIDEPLNKDGSSNFLEVELNTTKDKRDLTMRYKYKNEEHFKHGTKRKLKIIVPYDSWGPKERHHAKLIGKFLRMETLTGNRTNKKDKRLKKAATPFIEECIEQGYPPQIILKSIKKLGIKDHQWKTIMKKITMATYADHPYGRRLGRPKFPEHNQRNQHQRKYQRYEPQMRHWMLEHQWNQIKQEWRNI